MNREILFRGKRKDNGEWVYGYYQFCMKEHLICDDIENGSYYEHLVIPETIGQYTGLKDKNGKKIFEGDVLINTTTGIKCIVKFYDTRFILSYKDREEDIEMYAFLHRMNNLFEVIGTIYDEEFKK